jgi:hypothetical protein
MSKKETAPQKRYDRFKQEINEGDIVAAIEGYTSCRWQELYVVTGFTKQKIVCSNCYQKCGKPNRNLKIEDHLVKLVDPRPLLEFDSFAVTAMIKEYINKMIKE